ncbi:MAG: class I SAM-dependent methyltransferase [Coriobacteriales bacterium]|jgi:trans-aconitate methyltransferase
MNSRLLELIPSWCGLRVLDLGCSTCEEGESLLEAGVHLTCVDQDGVTMEQTAKRLPAATCIASDAARFVPKSGERFDVVLMRRPDVAIQKERWHAVFGKIPSWIAKDGRVIVTTPGAWEARIVRTWLKEIGTRNIKEVVMDWKDEQHVLIADGIEPRDELPSEQTPAEMLAWESDEIPMVCDVRTGKCTPVSELGQAASNSSSDSEI